MIEMSCAPYVPSKPEVVQKMLEIADVKTDDIVYDLGCGDGRILIKAVEAFKVKKAIGYELDKQRYKSTIKEIQRRNLQDRIEIIHGNLFEADLSDATVITLYLTS
ncbi:MAG: SAM-dependent methyltransferase, partial [Promethearchaeota archaeon]